MSKPTRDVRAIEALLGKPPVSPSAADAGKPPVSPSAADAGKPPVSPSAADAGKPPVSPTSARALVDHFGSLTGLLVARRAELVAAGLTQEDVRRLLAVRKLASMLARRRRARRLSSPRLVAQLVPHLSWHPVEEVWVVTVDATQRALGCTLIARGSAASCAVMPSEILGPVLRHRARGVFVLHNHPSGDPTPSAADEAFTERLCEAAKLLMVRIEDHIVIGGARFATIISRRRGAIAAPAFETATSDGSPRRRAPRSGGTQCLA